LAFVYTNLNVPKRRKEERISNELQIPLEAPRGSSDLDFAGAADA
jgi:hypothetical protein